MTSPHQNGETPIFADLMEKPEHRDVPQFMLRERWNFKDALAQADAAIARRTGVRPVRTRRSVPSPRKGTQA